MPERCRWYVAVAMPIRVFLILYTIDTLFKQKYFPYDLIKKSQHVVLAVTEKGGHGGWFTNEGVEGNEEVYSTGLRRWYTTPIVEWFEAMHRVRLSS